MLFVTCPGLCVEYCGIIECLGHTISWFTDNGIVDWHMPEVQVFYDKYLYVLLFNYVEIWFKMTLFMGGGFSKFSLAPMNQCLKWLIIQPTNSAPQKEDSDSQTQVYRL